MRLVGLFNVLARQITKKEALNPNHINVAFNNMNTSLPAAASVPAYPRTAAPLTANGYLLTVLYCIIPACAAVVVIDILLLDQVLALNYLPSSPEQWLIWAVVFETPHILASFFSFADKDYYRFYQLRIFKALTIFSIAVVLFTVIAPLVLPSALARLLMILFSAYVITYTMYHLLSQQLGVAISMMKIRPGKLYNPFRWSATISATFMYALVIVDDDLYFAGVRFGGIFEILAAAFVAITCVLGYNLAKDSNNRKGTWYLYSNLVMLVAVYAFLQLGYGVFVIMVPRFVHDITAFYIYALHDHNRNLQTRHNYIYRSFSFLSPLIVCPVLAVTLSVVLEQSVWFVAPLLIMGLLHYYVEGFIWRGDTLHRRQVAFR
jgi:hypothetical protein